MGRRKKKTLELKPFCYYCDRSFEDEKILLLHQKARHFKCRRCNRKLDTATGLVVHLLSVHKETINKVPNALKERESPELVVHGMSGVPPELVAEKQKILVEELGVKKNTRFEHTIFGSGLFDNLGGSAAAFAGMFSGQLFPGALANNFPALHTSTLPDISLLTKILSGGPNTSSVLSAALGSNALGTSPIAPTLPATVPAVVHPLSRLGLAAAPGLGAPGLGAPALVNTTGGLGAPGGLHGGAGMGAGPGATGMSGAAGLTIPTLIMPNVLPSSGQRPSGWSGGLPAGPRLPTNNIVGGPKSSEMPDLGAVKPPPPPMPDHVVAAQPQGGVLVYDDDLVSPEEKRALMYNYRQSLVLDGAKAF